VPCRSCGTSLRRSQEQLFSRSCDLHFALRRPNPQLDRLPGALGAGKQAVSCSPFNDNVYKTGVRWRQECTSQRSLSTFNKYAGTKVDTKLASLEALNAIKAKPGHVCPLICQHGLKAGADTCVKITCRAGYRVNDDNECEKVQDKKPVATRDDKNKRDLERKQIEAAPPKVEAKPSGQSLCNTAGCRPVRSGCRLGGGLQNGFQREYCN
jgi:hypothetical protein